MGLTGSVMPDGGRRTVMGFVLPSWQRGLVWTEAQKIAFIESAWRGVPIGTYTYNEAPIGSPLDYLLIDGQQRMNAIQEYIEGELQFGEKIAAIYASLSNGQEQLGREFEAVWDANVESLYES